MAEQLVAYGSRLGIYYAEEDSWGVLGSAPTVYKLRATDFGIQLGRDNFTTNELRGNRQKSDVRLGMFNVSGDIPIEFSYGSFDDLLESLFFNTWSSAGTLEVGDTQKSFTIQRSFLDIGEHHAFSGCVVNSFSLSIAPNSIVTGTFSFIGKDMTLTETLTNPIDKSTSSPFDSFTGTIKEGGTTIAIVTGLDITINNNIDPLQVLMNNKPVGLGEGDCDVTGTLTAYFDSSSLLQKFVNETVSSLEVTLTDLNSNSYTIYIPKIKYTGGEVATSGSNSPVTVSLPFMGLYDDTYSIIQITR